MYNKRSGFTLVELIIVAVIISILAAIAIIRIEGSITESISNVAMADVQALEKVRTALMDTTMAPSYQQNLIDHFTGLPYATAPNFQIQPGTSFYLQLNLDGTITSGVIAPSTADYSQIADKFRERIQNMPDLFAHYVKVVQRYNASTYVNLPDGSGQYTVQGLLQERVPVVIDITTPTDGSVPLKFVYTYNNSAQTVTYNGVGSGGSNLNYTFNQGVWVFTH